MPVLSKVIKTHGTVPLSSGNAKRAIHTLSDGSTLAILFDANSSTQTTGDQTNVWKVYIYWSADRLTWTLKNTFTPTSTWTALYATAVDAANNLHFCFRTTNGSGNYFLFTYAAGAGNPTWTQGSLEVIYTDTSIGNIKKFDMDTIDSGSTHIPVLIVYRIVSSAPHAQVYVRKTNATAGWVLGYDVTLFSGQSTFAHKEEIAVASESAPASLTAVRLAIMATKVATSTDAGDLLSVLTCNSQTGVTTLVATTYSNLNQGQGAGWRGAYLFGSFNNTFTWGQPVGTNSAFWTVGRIDRSGAVIVPASSTSKTGGFSKSESIEFETTMTYQDGAATLLVIGTNGRVYGTQARFNSDNTVTFSKGTYNYWDNGTTPYYTASALYGAGNKNLESGYRQHNAVISYGFNGTAPSTRGYFSIGAYRYRKPARVVPVQGQSLNTDQPQILMDIDIDFAFTQGGLKGYWDFAQDSGFTTSLRTFTQADAKFVLPNGTDKPNTVFTVTDQLASTSELFTGTWYVRGCYIDLLGVKHTFSTPTSFTVLHKPSATNLSPTGGSVNIWNVGLQNFSWSFSDPSPTDSQSAYQIIVENNDTGASILDSGKITSTSTSAILTLPSVAKDQNLRWKIRLWDGDNTQGLDSSYQFFIKSDAPIITITSPTASQIVTTAKPTVAWSTVFGGTRTPVAYRVVFSSANGIVFDSQWQFGSNTSYTPATTILQNTQSYTVTVYVRDNLNLEGNISQQFTTSWVVPAAPLSVVSTAASYDVDGLGNVTISWANTSIDAEHYSWRVYRKSTLSGVATTTVPLYSMIYETFDVLAGGYAFNDYSAPSGYKVDYYVTQVATRFDSLVESVTLFQLNSGTVAAMTTVFPSSQSYWLIDATGNQQVAGMNMKLSGVTAESFTDEYEEEVIHVIGRGRHIDEGDRLGYTGTLSAHIRTDGSTNQLYPRSKRLRIEDLKKRQTPVYLRTPFGDVFKVSLQNLGWERIAGVGQSEFLNLSIPYTEVY